MKLIFVGQNPALRTARPGRRAITTGVLSLVLSVVAAGAHPGEVRSRPSSGALLEAVTYRTSAHRTIVTLKLNGRVRYRTASLPQPRRSYIDLLNTRISPQLRDRRLEVGHTSLQTIRIGQFRSDVTRVVFDLNSPVPAQVRLLAGSVVVTIGGSAASRLPAAGSVTALPLPPPSPRPPPPAPRAPGRKPSATPSPQPAPVAEDVGARGESSTGRVAGAVGSDGERVEPPVPVPVTPSESRKRNGLDYLVIGQRIKVEGTRFEDGVLIAQEIEVVEGGGALELEGLVASAAAGDGSFMVASILVRVGPETRFEDSRRRPADASLLSRGRRAKVKFTSFESPGVVIAEVVRIYEVSGDIDFEIEAPIESLNSDTLELTTSIIALRITPRTRFPNLSADSDFSGSGVRRGLRRDDDEPRVGPIRLGPVLLGGKLGLSYEQDRNFNVDDDGRQDWFTAQGQLEASLPFGEHNEAYARLSFNRRADLSDPKASAVSRLRVRDAFLYLGHFFHPGLGLQIGRQRFRDKREWFYDDRLDSVRLHFARSRFRAEASVARALFRPTGSRSDQLYLIGSAQVRLSGRRYLTGYVIKRNDLTPRDEDPLWFGVSSRGRLTRSLDYWLEASRMSGRRRSNRLSGYGFDVGGSYRLHLPLQPTLTLGYAFGSGDSDPSDGVDGNFRQTGLQDNSYRHNGLKRYRYYGVLTEPELSNLMVGTVDVGLRPFQMWSVNFAYHNYRQVVASSSLGDFRLDIEPSGLQRGLGQEFDVVLAIRDFKTIDLNLLSGLFFPGPAFEGAVPRAFIVRAEIRYFF